ncbi:hypothetical protein OCU04_012151 [Sclerotinia nivalis]|uniref:Uncharacterized protein n=1 Tax=Sclerotinia nivalis TaxID=352851 RepID=A0A9X0DFU2_9HELO|nr:hypothetical protein OCU04_012151 [Sclerotinia nivalis]
MPCQQCASPTTNAIPNPNPPGNNYLENIINNNPDIFQTFNSTRWLLNTERQYIQPTHYRELLSKIFHAPDYWWDEFLQICDLTLQPKFSHSNTSVWNFYTTSQIISMRSEYLTGGRTFADTSGEICNWLAFCIRELRNWGMEWNTDPMSSPTSARDESSGYGSEVRSGRRNETQSERRERRQREHFERAFGRRILRGDWS